MIDSPAMEERQALLKQYSVLLPSMSRRKVTHDGRPDNYADRNHVVQLSTTRTASTNHNMYDYDSITDMPEVQNSIDLQTDHNLISMHQPECQIEVVPMPCEMSAHVFV